VTPGFSSNISLEKHLPSHLSYHMTSFRFQAKNVLLTYAQCGDLCGFSVNSHLGDLGAECIVAREEHADGGSHLHVFAQWERQFRSRRSDVFDVGGRHPNIEGHLKSPQKAYDYAIKDGDVIAGSLARPSGVGPDSVSDKWGSIVDADTEDEFWCRVRELDPKALCINYPALRKYADHAYVKVAEPYQSPAGFEFALGAVPELDEWARTSLGASAGTCSAHFISCIYASSGEGVVWL
jgi:hypothetical protein